MYSVNGYGGLYLAGLDAALPPPGVVGRTYHSTDRGATYADHVLAWAADPGNRSLHASRVGWGAANYLRGPTGVNKGPGFLDTVWAWEANFYLASLPGGSAAVLWAYTDEAASGWYLGLSLTTADRPALVLYGVNGNVPLEIPVTLTVANWHTFGFSPEVSGADLLIHWGCDGATGTLTAAGDAAHYVPPGVTAVQSIGCLPSTTAPCPVDLGIANLLAQHQVMSAATLGLVTANPGDVRPALPLGSSENFAYVEATQYWVPGQMLVSGTGPHPLFTQIGTLTYSRQF